VPLLSKYQNKSPTTVQRTLTTLMERQYIQRRFDSSYRRLNRSASYSLAKHGIGYLRNNFTLDDSAARTMYKNSSVTEAFVQHSLDVLGAHTRVSSMYASQFNALTRAETAGHADQFPAPRPDLYLIRKEPIEGLALDYMMDVFTDTQTFVIKKRLDAYIKHYESGDWEEDDYPAVLIACPDERSQKQIQEYAEHAKDDLFIEEEDLTIMTTTSALLLRGDTKDIWSDQVDQQTKVSL